MVSRKLPVTGADNKGPGLPSRLARPDQFTGRLSGPSQAVFQTGERSRLCSLVEVSEEHDLIIDILNRCNALVCSQFVLELPQREARIVGNKLFDQPLQLVRFFSPSTLSSLLT